MRLARMAAAAAAGALLVTTLVTVPAAAATTTNYAALGDSYSAGVGTDDYYQSSGNCDRSPRGYPALFEAAHTVSSFDFAACSGARTTDVLNGQLGGLSASTTLVTLTVGGNDAGFSSVMETCVLGGDGKCQTAVANAENYIQTTLPGLLNNLYTAIRQKAPNAIVVVLGYPRLYQLGGSCVVGLSDTSRGYIDNGADVLDNTIAAAAQQHGFTFVDVRGAFSSHEICSNDWWLNSVTLPISDSYHPNRAGYANGYLPALDTAVG